MTEFIPRWLRIQAEYERAAADWLRDASHEILKLGEDPGSGGTVPPSRNDDAAAGAVLVIFAAAGLDAVASANEATADGWEDLVDFFTDLFGGAGSAGDEEPLPAFETPE